MSTTSKLRPGARVRVLWGHAEPRGATVVEVWGDPDAPSDVRVKMDRLDDEGDVSVLLLPPEVLLDPA